jgi:hypothetical protein
VAGYSAEQLNVELLSDHDGAETCHELFGMTRDSHAGKDRLTVCCALARLEGFAQGRASELLRYPGAGAFHSLCAESDQLTGVACSVRRWLLSKAIGAGKNDDCLSGFDKLTDVTRNYAIAAEATGTLNLWLQGVMAAALTVWQQVRAFHHDVRPLLDHHESRRERTYGKDLADPCDEPDPKTSTTSAPPPPAQPPIVIFQKTSRTARRTPPAQQAKPRGRSKRVTTRKKAKKHTP